MKTNTSALAETQEETGEGGQSTDFLNGVLLDLTPALSSEERGKRSQRLEAGTRRVVEGFAGAGFRWRGLTSAATESSWDNSLPGGLDGIGPAPDELVRVRVNDSFGAGMGRFFDRVGAGFYRFDQISIADKPSAGSLVSISAVRMAER